jgi:hypothetical protein
MMGGHLRGGAALVPAAPRLRLNLVALAVSVGCLHHAACSFTCTSTHPRDSSVACLDANMFDPRPVALDIMPRGTVSVYRARIPARQSLPASQACQARNRRTSCLMPTEQAGVWLNSHYPNVHNTGSHHPISLAKVREARSTSSPLASPS